MMSHSQGVAKECAEHELNYGKSERVREKKGSRQGYQLQTIKQQKHEKKRTPALKHNQNVY